MDIPLTTRKLLNSDRN